MLHSYVVSYDLSKPGRDYEELLKFLRSLSDWAKPLQSVWIVRTPLSAYELAEKVLEHMDSNDHLLVTPIVPGSAWYNLPPKVEEWLGEGRAA